MEQILKPVREVARRPVQLDAFPLEDTAEIDPGSYTRGMADLQRLEFEERDGQWLITEVYTDGRFEPGEPFMASGHESYSKLQQVLGRVKDIYPGYRPTRIPYDMVNATRFLLEVVPEQSE